MGKYMGPVWCLFALLLSTATGHVCADGKFYPPTGLPTEPSIPSQTALIVYEAGTETLVVESTAATDAQKLGWIIPLPAEPHRLEAVQPGLLTTLRWAIGPRYVTAGNPNTLVILLALGATVLTVGLYGPQRLRKDWCGSSRLRLLLAVLLVEVAMITLTPTLSMSSGSAASGADAAGDALSQRVGNYDVGVLEPGSADELSKWLTDNGLAPLPETDAPVVEAYIRDGWVFVAARLRREGDGPATPHPLLASFPCDAPVYPMRLTGNATDALSLDLFVATREAATASNLTCEVTDRFAWTSADRPDTADCLRGKVTNLQLTHPGTEGLVPDGYFISRLSGTLSPEQMADDIHPALARSEATRRAYHSPGGRWYRAALWAAWGLLAASLLAWIPTRTQDRMLKPILKHVPGTLRDRDTVRPAVRMTCVVLAAAFASSVCGVGGFVVTETRNVRTMHVPYVRVAGQAAGLARLLEVALVEKVDSLDTAELMAREIMEGRRPVPEEDKADFEELTENVLTGGPLREEYSPGNYQLRRENGQLQLCVVGMDGTPWGGHWPVWEQQAGALEENGQDERPPQPTPQDGPDGAHPGAIGPR